MTGDDPVGAYRIIRAELKAYSPALAKKPEVIAFNKIDAISAEDLATKLADFKRRVRKTPALISGATQKGVDDVMKKLLTVIDTAKAAERGADAPGVTTEEWRP